MAATPGGAARGDASTAALGVDRYAVFGNPVAHSRSPWIHARFAELCGEPLSYEAVAAPLDGFAAAVRAFHASGARGGNVTVPFKFEAAALAGTRTPRAELAGACNTLVFADDGTIRGDNTDGCGLVHDIELEAGVPIRGAMLLLLGAGGAAAGVLGPLLRARPRQVVVWNRTASNASSLVDRHRAWAASCEVALEAVGGALPPAPPKPFSIVVNATASSLAGDAIALPRGCVGPGSLAVDLMYGATADAFLRPARDAGATTRDGLGMLVAQAAEAFALWRGVRPPIAPVLAELRAIVDRARAAS